MRASAPIILIDDDRAWLDTLADFLEAKGFRVCAAQGGTRGLSLLESSEAALAIVDLHMPEMDGLELLRLLRQRGRALQVLMLSSDDDPGLPARVLAEGARAFLPKTMAPALLLRTLLQLLASLGLAAECDRWLPVPHRRLYLPVPSTLFEPNRN